MKPEIGECSITINNVLRLEEEVKQLQSALKLCVEALEGGFLVEAFKKGKGVHVTIAEAIAAAKPLLEKP
jgi:hypothetical protein